VLNDEREENQELNDGRKEGNRFLSKTFSFLNGTFSPLFCYYRLMRNIS
jgi:hypothetical protein